MIIARLNKNLDRLIFSRLRSGKFTNNLVVFPALLIITEIIFLNIWTSLTASLIILYATLGLMVCYFIIVLILRIQKRNFDLYLLHKSYEIKDEAIDLLDEEPGLYSPSDAYQIKQVVGEN